MTGFGKLATFVQHAYATLRDLVRLAGYFLLQITRFPLNHILQIRKKPQLACNILYRPKISRDNGLN